MKIHIPEFKAMAKCNQHLDHAAFNIEIDDDLLVKHGRWEVNELGYLVCTHCAWVRYGIPLVEHYPYCPNCGAKMDLEE